MTFPRSIFAESNICFVALIFVSLLANILALAWNVPKVTPGGCIPMPITEPLELGEGPHWDATQKKLYFVDMKAHELHSYDPQNKQHNKAKVEGDEDVTLVLPIADKPGEFIIGHGGKLDRVSWDGSSEMVTTLDTYATLETTDDVRLNDGKCSPDGVIFAGSMAQKLPDQTVPKGKGNLFVIDRRNGTVQPRKLLKNVDLSNGLCWDQKQNYFYWADTTKRKIYKYVYNKSTLDISHEQVLLDYKEKKLKGNPDGMTIDASGKLFIACVDGGGEVIRVDTTNGKVLNHIVFPNVSDVSSTAFGGPNLEDLYITTIRKDGEPLSGSLFVCEGLGTRGYAGAPAKI